MKIEDSPLLQDLLLTTKDGDWGKGNPEDGLLKYQVIRATDFSAASLGNMGNVPTRYLPAHTVSRRTLQENDILIETAGGSPGRPTGRTMLVTDRVMAALSGPATCASFARFLRVDGSRIDARYLYWFLQAMYQSGEIEQYQVQHTGVARFQYTAFAATQKISLPALGQQRAIAEVLGALDDKIAANTKLAETSAALANTLFRHTVQDSSDELVLAEITTLLSRGITPKYDDGEDTMTILNQKCVRGQRVDLAPSRRTLLSKVRPDKVLQLNDVLVNSTGQGTLGRVARWTKDGTATVDSHITVVRFDGDKVDPVVAGLGLLGIQETIIEMGEGSTGQTELSRVELGKLRVRLPNHSAQAQLGRRLASMSGMEMAHITENQTLVATRDALLPQLMSGKLRVKDAEILVSAAV